MPHARDHVWDLINRSLVLALVVRALFAALDVRWIELLSFSWWNTPLVFLIFNAYVAMMVRRAFDDQLGLWPQR